MSDTSYNGWTNYETWAVGLYLDGNYDGESTYRYALDLAREHTEAIYLASALQDFVTESFPDLGASIAADLLNAAVSEVNWLELAEAKLAEVKESSC